MTIVRAPGAAHVHLECPLCADRLCLLVGVTPVPWIDAVSACGHAPELEQDPIAWAQLTAAAVRHARF